jgi:hypothetical protein
VTGRRGRFDCGWNIEWFRRIQEVNRLRVQITVLLDTNLRLRLVNIDWGEVINHVVAENVVPLIGFEVGQGVNRGSDSCKPVIEHNTPLGGDATCVGIEDERCSQGVIGGEAHVDKAFRTGLPLGNLLAIDQRIIQNVDWAAPNMQVVVKRSCGECPIEVLGMWLNRKVA